MPVMTTSIRLDMCFTETLTITPTEMTKMYHSEGVGHFTKSGVSAHRASNE